MYDDDFTVSIREFQRTDNLKSIYYAVIFDTDGQIRSQGKCHSNKNDALNDARCFLENIPTRVY